jgi:hypothetical protein
MSVAFSRLVFVRSRAIFITMPLVADSQWFTVIWAVEEYVNCLSLLEASKKKQKLCVYNPVAW